jgi:hypothetical protein
MTQPNARTVRTWQGEFTDFPAEGMPPRVLELVERGTLRDRSWHNDTSPSFDLEPLGWENLVLWVDYPDPTMRENEGMSRYAVALDEDTVYDGDSLDAALAKVEEVIAKRFENA